MYAKKWCHSFFGDLLKTVSLGFLKLPQGGVLGPLLFLLYTNELPSSLTHSRVPMFADDSKCYRQIIIPQDRELFQEDLNSLHQ